MALMTDPKFIIWSPVTRADIAWNFEKFLINKDGIPIKRCVNFIIKILNFAYLSFLIKKYFFMEKFSFNYCGS